MRLQVDMKVSKPITFRSYDFSRASIATYFDSEGFLVTADEDVLRIGYNPSTLGLIGAIAEGEATNEITYSNDFTNAAWTKTTASISTDSGDFLPDGGTGARTYLDITSTGGKLERANPLSTDVIGTFSVFLKGRTGLQGATLGGCGASVQFDFTGDGSFTPGASATIQKLPHGWFRCSVTGPKSATHLSVSGYTTAVCSLYVWGAQMETGPDVTSYIATVATVETRAEDIVVNQPPRVVSTNVDENDAPLWEGGTYAADYPVVVLGSHHRVYRSVIENTDKFPPDNPDIWIDQGATNTWRMFDMTVGAEKQTVSTDSNNTIDVLMDLDSMVTSVSLLNVYASSVRVIMRDSLGDIVYDKTVTFLSSPSGPDWWSFFFNARRRNTTLSLTDLPNVRPCTLQVIVDGDDDYAKLGKLIVGEAIEIGCVRYGSSVGIVDFSRKERDAFGNNFVLERRYVNKAEFDIQIDTSRVDEVQDLLASVRATPVVYIGDEEFRSTIIYGFYRDFSIVLSGPKKSDCTLSVEGI